MLLPAGVLADRYGRVRVMRLGLLVFAAGALACAAAQSYQWVIAAKFAQGAGGALVLPAALATLRSAYTDPAERTRILGTWAAWSGVAGAAGPLIAGTLVDLWSWRAVFIPSAAGGLAAIVLLIKSTPAGASTRSDPVPGRATVALMILLGALAYLLIQAPRPA